VDAAHAGDGGIACPQGVRWIGRDEFGNACRAVPKVRGKQAPVSKGVVDLGSQAESVPVAVGVAEGVLECAEQTPTSWDGKGHGTEFSQELVPRCCLDMGLARADQVEQSSETVDAVRGQLDGAGNSINQPT
jgi:hypothetical protein